MSDPKRKPEFLSLESLDTRLTAVELGMEGFKLQMLDVGNEVKANTRLTEEIHGDTKSIVAATKWLSTTRRLLLAVFIGVSATSGAIVGAVHTLKVLHVIP